MTPASVYLPFNLDRGPTAAPRPAWRARIPRAGSRGEPAAGRGPEDVRPGFDQQPIEAGQLAAACARAFVVTENREWLEPLRLCVRWFEGLNDAGTPMFDPGTGGCFDGLEPAGVNENQGAESTIALIGTLQLARMLEARGAPRQRTARSAAST